MNERLERTIAIAKKIRDSGYELTKIWECEYDRMLKPDAEMSAFVENHSLTTSDPLNPRDVFFGGRIENMVTLYAVKDTEQIRYVDVCSLYLYICNFGKYQVSHPRVYVDNECIEGPVLTGSII